MRHKGKNILRLITKHLGLQLRYVSYFDDDTHGRLLVRERRILLNAHKPKVEHFYTILHELGHFLLHVRKLYRKHHPKYLDTLGKIEFLAKGCSKARRYLRYIFNNGSAREWDADLWGMCAFKLLANRFDFCEELKAFLRLHPEKKNIYRLATLGVWYGDTKSRIKKFSDTLLLLFRVAHNPTQSVATKLGRLQSVSTWPPFRLCARSVALKLHLPPRQTFSQLA